MRRIRIKKKPPVIPLSSPPQPVPEGTKVVICVDMAVEGAERTVISGLERDARGWSKTFAAMLRSLPPVSGAMRSLALERLMAGEGVARGVVNSAAQGSNANARYTPPANNSEGTTTGRISGNRVEERNVNSRARLFSLGNGLAPDSRLPGLNRSLMFGGAQYTFSATIEYRVDINLYEIYFTIRKNGDNLYTQIERITREQIEDSINATIGRVASRLIEVVNNVMRSEVERSVVALFSDSALGGSRRTY